jgi:sulfotransferase 6B1
MADWRADLKKNRLFRKALSSIAQIPRAVRRCSASPEDYRLTPPVIGNSFPKSGTHLLLQVLEGIPGIVNFGSYISSMPALTFRERSRKTHLQMISRVVPGEVVPANLFFDPAYHAELNRKNCAIFFIYRDFRDVAVSEADYLTHSYRIHRMHSYYAKILDNRDERVSAAILGVTDPGFPYDYPSIAGRFARYRGWLYCPDVLAVKFEDIVSDNCYTTLHQIAAFYAKRCASTVDVDDLARSMAMNIQPSKSYTFRKGKTGGWKDVFTEEHKAQMKSVAGELLIELGYEQDLNW